MAKKNTGGVMKVTFAPLTEDAKSLTVARSSSLRDVLDAAGYGGDLDMVRVNGREATSRTTVKAGDFIAVLAPVSGGSK